MAHHQRGLRAELAAILSVDEYTLEDLGDNPVPLVEPISTHLSHLIVHSIHHPIESRAVHAFLPILFLRIFGYVSGHGWLETISAHPHKDRHALLSLVAPHGPVHVFCSHASAQAPQHAPDLMASHSAVNPDHMCFEFPMRNLPSATSNALRAIAAERGGGFSSTQRSSMPSYLAPLLASRIKARDPSTLLLDPLTYFLLCLVAAPAHKAPADGVPDGTNPITLKRIRRSTSLPTTRALYNQLIASYASLYDPTELVDRLDVFIPAMLDFLFMPWAFATAESMPLLSSAAADAAASVTLSLLPPTPNALVPMASAGGKIVPTLSIQPQLPPLHSLSNAAAVYMLTPHIVSALVRFLIPSDRAVAPFLAYGRLLALYVAPWRGSVRSAVRFMVFPRARSTTVRGTNGGAATNGGAVGSGASGGNFGTKFFNDITLTPTNVATRAGRAAFAVAVTAATTAVTAAASPERQHGQTQNGGGDRTAGALLQRHTSSPVRSPHNASRSKESRWRAAFAGRLPRVDARLLAAAVVQASTLRVAALPEGNRVLAVLTDAAQSARLGPAMYAGMGDSVGEEEEEWVVGRREDVVVAIETLRTQQATLDLSGMSKAERGYLPVLSSVLGVPSANGGMLQNLSEMVQGGAHSVKGVVDRVSGNVSATSDTPSSLAGSVKRRRALERRMSISGRGMCVYGEGGDGGGEGAVKVDVQFLGGIWDLPIDSGEVEVLVLTAYWIALRLEPYFGHVPNMRFLGRIWVWVVIVMTVVVVTMIRAISSSG